MSKIVYDETSNRSWKRMSFKGNKVWAALADDDKFLEQNNKLLIKYNLKQNYEYWVKKENLKPEKEAFKKKSSRKPKSTKKQTHNTKTDYLSVPENAIIIYTDGASSGNPGPAGIGVLLIYGKHQKEISEFIGNTTNNIAELKAIKRAVQELKTRDIPVRIFTDSSYCTGLLTMGWKPEKNTDLVNSIKKLISRFKDLKIIKIKGHDGIEGNEKADKLATSAIKKHTANNGQ